MNKLRVVTAKDMEKILFSLGFVAVRQKGSHVFYRHKDGRVTTIPHHRGRGLAKGLLRAILRDVNLSLDDFENLFLLNA